MAGTPASSRGSYTGSYPVVNADIAAGAAIAYSKLNLATSIVNTDVAVAAAIAVSKLAAGTAGQVLGGTGPSYALPPGYEFDYVQDTAGLTVTATTSATAQTLLTGAAVTYDGATIILVECFLNIVQPGTTLGDRVTVCLFDNGTSIGNIAAVQNPTVGQALVVTVYAGLRITPSAAAHTYTIRCYRTGTTNGSIFDGAGGVDTRTPSFMRITKV